jgi:hypothetical protein
MTIATDLPQYPPPAPWWVQGVKERCVVCNGLHKDPATSGTTCLFYSSNGGVGGAPILRAKNMLNHDMVIVKNSFKWYLGMKFINELKEYILPRLGIVETKDIDKVITELSYAVKKMREEGTKSMHAQLDWGTNEIPAANNEKSPVSSGKSPTRKVTPKKSPSSAKLTSSTSKSALKSPTPKYVAPEYHDEEDYEEEYMLDDEM